MSSPEIQRTQFPLTFAWAYTIHKVQGLTLSKAVFSFELFKQRQFSYGQAYVGLRMSATGAPLCYMTLNLAPKSCLCRVLLT